MTTFIGKKRQQEAADAYGIPSVNDIRENLATSDEWCYRALIAIFDHQTEEEQEQATTKEDNGIGFTGADAELLTSFAIQYIDRGWLSDKQMAYLRKKITKYANQLWWVAYAKAIAAATEEMADGVADQAHECDACGGVARNAGPDHAICVDCGCQNKL